MSFCRVSSSRFLAVALACALVWGSQPCLAQEGIRAALMLDANGNTVAAENLDLACTPASVAKLWVVAAGLHHLGPDFRVETVVTAEAPLNSGELIGDLVVHGAGDPTWNSRFFPGRPLAALEALAGELKRSGLRRVRGDLIVDSSQWPGRSSPANRSISELPMAYGASTSALAIQENTVRVEIAPGAAVGQPARARFLQDQFSLRLENRMVTVGRERDGQGTVEILPVWFDQKLVLRGEYPISEKPYALDLTLPDPQLTAGLALQGILKKAGVEILGKTLVRDQPARGRALAKYRGHPLESWLPAMLAESNNWYAEMLNRQLAAQLEGTGRADQGLRLLEKFAEEVVGSPKGAVRLDDASGLSPYNLVTPRATVQLLQWVDRQPWAKLFREALATPQQGTLQSWPAGLPEQVAAKTGTLQNALGLAGFLPQRGGTKVFAIFLNHRPDRTPLRREIVDWVGSTAREKTGATQGRRP